MVLPVTTPGLVTMLVINFRNGRNDLLHPLSFSSSEAAKTLSVAITYIDRYRASLIFHRRHGFRLCLISDSAFCRRPNEGLRSQIQGKVGPIGRASAPEIALHATSGGRENLQFTCNNTHLTCDHLVTYNTHMEHESAFRALADPSRRRLLDLLFERDGRTLSELESDLPMTRFGVMKHLRLLEKAGLLTTRKVGREKLHYLNPVPIQLISDRWINKYSAARLSALADLKSVLEGGTVMTIEAKPQLVYQIIIKAPQERVWEAITKPEFTARYYYDCTLKSDLSVGSPFTYHKPSGAPIIEGQVVLCDPPKRLVHTYHSLWPPMNKDAPTQVSWELESLPGGVTKVTVVHAEFQGETATYQGLQSGGWAWILSNMKTLLETGEPLPQGY